MEPFDETTGETFAGIASILEKINNGIVLIATLLFFATTIHGQTVVINEFMAKNSTTIQDEDGDFSDWIELFNPGDSTVNLLNYRLSDDSNNLDKWFFPEVHLLPNSYLLLFASKKDRTDTTMLHTNFKISSGGEALFLSDQSGRLIDQTEIQSLSDDASYCRIPDGSTRWIITTVPTPKATNNEANQLHFSNQEGFYTAPFFLSITSASGDTIYYTLNGNLPSPNTSYVTAPLHIVNRNSEPNLFSEIPTTPEQDLISLKAWESPQKSIDKATILRCASYRNGIRTSKVYTKSYFVDSTIMGKYTMPVISLITEADNLFHNDSGLYVPGVHFNRENPERTGNYFMHGRNWEREIHIEYFEPNGNLGFAQDAGVRIHGGKTRQAAQKSLRLYARNAYGKKYFNYPLLPHRQNDNYKRFLLRTTMGGWEGQTIITDVLGQKIASPLNIDYQEFQPVIVFINGEYWGIHTMRDRIDERYIAYVHNIDKEAVEFKEHDNEAYEDLMNFIANNSLAFEDNYHYVTTQIDLHNYIDYTIAELFFNNYDWPTNNIKLWRKVPEGKWRWILYDLDAGFRDETYNMLLHATTNDASINWPNSPESTFLFRNLLTNDSFKAAFMNRYASILNREFDGQRMRHMLDSIKGLYAPEITVHSDRWNYPNSLHKWEEDIANELGFFMEKRPCIVREQIMSFFELTDFDFDCGDFTSPSLILAPNPNRGQFFLSNTHSDITDATLTITNLKGQQVYREHGVTIMNNNRKYIDLSHFSENVYVLRIVTRSYSMQKKIIITK